MFSRIFPAMFLLGTLFFDFSPVQAWNPEYGHGLPRQRRMCAKRDSAQTILFYSILPDEDCPKGTTRYVVVFGRKPRDSMALIRSTTSLKFYPPLTLTWPSEQKKSRTSLWHFTCVLSEEREILESKVRLFKYKGEITSENKHRCAEAQQRALTYCQNQLKGEELLESCPVPLGI